MNIPIIQYIAFFSPLFALIYCDAYLSTSPQLFENEYFLGSIII